MNTHELDPLGHDAVRVLAGSPSLGVAERYAETRADQHLNPADAIHLATASVSRANLFLTNDSAISKLTVPGIDFVAGLNVNLF
jgi:hypothetical protein